MEVECYACGGDCSNGYATYRGYPHHIMCIPTKPRPAMKSNLIDIACIVRSETDRAICVEHTIGKPAWLPKSQIEVEPNPDGKTVTVSLPEWLAVEKGIV